jgi:hypothetical protein
VRLDIRRGVNRLFVVAALAIQRFDRSFSGRSFGVVFDGETPDASKNLNNVPSRPWMVTRRHNVGVLGNRAASVSSDIFRRVFK